MSTRQRPGQKIKLQTLEEMLGVVGEESAMEIEIEKIHPFKNHPFHVVDDARMQDLIESIRTNGILTPAIVRSVGKDEYEMISGHRRMHAAQKLGIERIPVIIREMSDDEAIVKMVPAAKLKAGDPAAVCAVLRDEKDSRSDRYEKEWNGFLQFSNIMQFLKEYIGVSQTGLDSMVYANLPLYSEEAAALPAEDHNSSGAAEQTKALDASTEGSIEEQAWNNVLGYLFDDASKAFANAAREEGIPAPSDDNVGYEVEDGSGEVIATVEIAWPDQKLGYMTDEQLEDKDKLQAIGWKIFDMLTLDELKAELGGKS